MVSVTVGSGLTVTLCDAIAEQLPGEVTVTMYVPALLTDIDCAVEVVLQR